ncbi:uncharacterized protein LOC111621084 [Centruroides sculpturatus]|uniref:uncharacterized protein LOC111621084 n=1 Tax=Centruroides sculpturatus TaxID=218467 RepID=UPI000C6E878F|nr:uncharacterized protein LOC111621084 [Centruroides sculpturatus]
MLSEKENVSETSKAKEEQVVNESPSEHQAVNPNPMSMMQTLMEKLTSSLPEFGGTTTESADEWLNYIELTRNQQRLAETQVLPLAISKLRGTAKNWHKAIGYQLNNWTEWKTSLKSEFGKRLTLRMWCDRVKEREQRQDESLTDYFYAKLCLLRTNCPVNVTEVDEIDYLLDGIKNKQYTITIATHDVHSIAELQRIARKIDEQETEARMHMKTQVQQPHKFSNNTNALVKDPAIAVDFIKRTDEKSIRRNPKWNAQMPLQMTRCYKCQQLGHLAKTCPNENIAQTNEYKAERGGSKEIKDSKKQKQKSNALNINANASKVHSPYINVEVSMIGKIRALVDTGSCRTIIRRDQLPDGIRMLDDNTTESTGIDMTKVKPIRFVDLPIRLQGQVTTVKTAVFENNPVPLTLGIDWISQAGVKVILKKDKCEIVTRDGNVIPAQPPIEEAIQESCLLLPSAVAIHTTERM